MNALRFGAPDHPKTRHLVSGVVAGVGGYGNSFGVPTVGGEVEFDPRYNGNCLVNAFAAGIAKTDAIFLSEAKGVGLPVVYLGAKTGRDGVGGATMASAEFDESIEEKRPTVQVGDPVHREMPAGSLPRTDGRPARSSPSRTWARPASPARPSRWAPRAISASSSTSTRAGARGAHDAYEMMLSESQERMLMVLRPEKEEEAKAIFHKWGLDFAIVGEDHRRSALPHPARRARKSPTCRSRNWATKPRNMTAHGMTALSPLPSPMSSQFADRRITARRCSICSARPTMPPRWVWEQYDTLIQGNSLQIPGGDAGVVRVEGHETKALAFSSDVTPRYVEADPFEGGKQAVAECWRNLTATGAEPLAATDNLNFGNPERPEIMGQLVGPSRASAKPAGARLPDRLGQCLALQRDQWRGDPADAHHRRRRPDAGLVHMARIGGDAMPATP
jgi:phosphoribosylformylglycinamidine (FGAM) synthase-like enzyme